MGILSFRCITGTATAEHWDIVHARGAAAAERNLPVEDKGERLGGARAAVQAANGGSRGY